ncbi:hypothetical protein Hanom_Chr12g01075921 [Helianthus anomalus]
MENSEPDFEGQVELIAVELKEGFNLEIVKNFRVPSRAVLEAPVPATARGIHHVAFVFLRVSF